MNKTIIKKKVNEILRSLVQFNPFPENPSLHSHSKDPSLSIQLALAAHGLTKHSSISIKLI